MEKVKVIIVDTGVKREHPLFAKEDIHGIGFSQDNILEEFEDTYGHGTAIYNIIRGAQNVEITNIKITDIEKGVSEDEIIDVLHYIHDNMQADVINLSLGVCMCGRRKELYEACQQLKEKGVILVSAFDNAGAMSYPAAFDNVIGVTTDYSRKGKEDYLFIDDSITNIFAYGRTQRLAWTEPLYLFMAGNSFACAHVTVQIAKFLNEGARGFEEILSKLKEHAAGVGELKEQKLEHELPFEIKKAALFPFNKEMHSVIRFSDLTSFEIAAVYDVKYSGHVGASTCHLLQDDKIEDIVIKNIDKVDWEQIDTIIIGHLDEIAAFINQKKLKKKLVEEAITHGKNVVAFDDDVAECINEHNRNMIYYPHVDKENLPAWREGKMYKIAKPVLGVFGTSSKQGKYTLQLNLRKRFQEKGFKVGQIGTEPTAKLFGLDFVYPMGYNNSVYLKEYDAVHYLNYVMSQLEKDENDIIIVGSQSGTVPYDIYHLGMLSIAQFNFLLGTQPDAVILCINPYDEPEYIERTIRFIESGIDTEVIALVVFPMNVSSNWTGMYGKKEKITQEQLDLLKLQLTEQFDRPVFGMSEIENDQLFAFLMKFYGVE